MIGSRSILLTCWIISATAALGNDKAGGNVVRKEPADDSNRSLRASVGGNLFGLFSKKTCRKMEDGVFETISTPRFRAFFGSLFGGSGSASDKDGACNDICKDLCPTSCFGSFNVDGSTCSCAASKCSGNAICNKSNKCQCRLGFNGNGLICCDLSSGLNFTEAGCVARPVAPSPTAPSAPGAALPTPGTTPITPAAPAPRAPSVARRDVLPPKLVDLVLLSSNVVDVSANDAKVDFQITMEDDWSGIKAIYVYVADALYRPILYNKTLSSPAFGKYVHSFSMPVSKYVSQGVGTLFIQVFDFADNYDEINAVVLAKLGLPYDIEIINAKTDTMPPKVLGMLPLTPNVVNVTGNTKPSTDVIFQVTAQDDFAGLQRLQVVFSNPSGSSISTSIDTRNSNLGYYYDNFRLAGEPVALNLTISVSNNQQLGTFTLSSVRATDYAMKNVAYSGANLTFTPTFTVVK